MVRKRRERRSERHYGSSRGGSLQESIETLLLLFYHSLDALEVRLENINRLP
jgi:hypothetical protein